MRPPLAPQFRVSRHLDGSHAFAPVPPGEPSWREPLTKWLGSRVDAVNTLKVLYEKGFRVEEKR